VVSYLLCSLIKNPEEEDPPEIPPQKLINFGGGSSGGGPLPPGFLFVNNPTKKAPREGGFLSTCLESVVDRGRGYEERHTNLNEGRVRKR